MASSSGRAPFSQDIFEDLEEAGNNIDPPTSDCENCKQCNKKIDDVLRRLEVISQAVFGIQAKLATDSFKVKGSTVEISLMEKAGRCFVDDPFFGQKAEKLSPFSFSEDKSVISLSHIFVNQTWLKPLLQKFNTDQRHSEECRRYVQRKCSDWRNNLRIKVQSADHKVESMCFEEFRHYMVSGMRFLPSSEMTSQLLLVLRWFVYENKLFGQVKGRRTSEAKLHDFWREFMAFKESKQAFLREENGWRELRQRDAVRSERAKRTGEARNSGN